MQEEIRNEISMDFACEECDTYNQILLKKINGRWTVTDYSQNTIDYHMSGQCMKDCNY